MPVGNINVAALNAPGVYVQIIPPSDIVINGIPTNVLGIVGIASWGPVNSPVTVSNPQDCTLNFGPPQVAKYDLATACLAASYQGANNFRLVRVTDGTDVSASIPVVDTASTPVTGFTATAIYTGTIGNTLQVTIGNGSKNSTFKVTLSRPNYAPEVFDNIAGSGAALWQAMVNAINNGISGVRGPSQLIMATLGTSTATPALKTYTLTGGTNGNTTITSTTLTGDDTATPRKGMYALRNTGCSVAFLTDADDSTQWTLQATFGQSEGVYMVLTGPAGQSISSAISAKSTAGIDNYDAKVMLGDWVTIFDTYNQQNRLISPQAFAAGMLANLSPEQSSLNKKMAGIIGTQKSAANQLYSAADIVQLSQAGIDVIAFNPQLGDYFACQTGQNTSSTWATSGDEYTRLTNFIAYTLVKGLAPFVGLLHNPDTRQTARNTLQSFLQFLAQLGMLGDVNGGAPYTVTLDDSNNPNTSVERGYMIADVRVAYFKIVRVFLVNYQGGQLSVTVQNQNQ